MAIAEFARNNKGRAHSSTTSPEMETVILYT